MEKIGIVLVVLIVLVGAITISLLLLNIPEPQKTCSEQNGYLCSQTSTCNDLLDASDGLCCFEPCIEKPKTCAELGGDLCSNASECKGLILTNASDTKFCCNQKCEKQISFSECKNLCPNESFCDKPLKTDGSFACCENSCTIPKTSSCNYNTICEGFENQTCRDCQCTGVVCGGLCYNYKGTCCDDKYIPLERYVVCKKENTSKGLGCSVPGWCFNTNKPLLVVFNIPNMYAIGEQKTGKITIKNNGYQRINESINWSYKQNFEIQSNGKKIEDEYKSINLLPDEEIDIPITIKAVKEYNLFLDASDPFSTLSLILQNNTYSSQWMRVYKKTNQTFCGNNSFDINGSCINNVFYPGAKCDFNKDDYFPLCSNGLKIDSIEFDYKNGKISLRTDIPSQGMKKVFVTRINNDVNLNTTKMQNWTETFFDGESQKIIGKNMLDFVFFDKGKVNIDWSTVNKSSDLQHQIENNLGIAKSDYDFLIGYTNKTQSKLIFNESAGVYLGDGLILIDINDMRYYMVAHEIAHGLGAPDLYTNVSYPQTCSAQFINDIMCGSAISLDEPKNYRLYSAPFIGWADINGNGIIDVDDSNIINVPTWFGGIEILEARPLIATITATGQKTFSVGVVVIDKKRKKLVPALARVSSVLFNDTVFSAKGSPYYQSKILPKLKIQINITAEFAGYTDNLTIYYDPNNYTYIPTKYNKSIHGIL